MGLQPSLALGSLSVPGVGPGFALIWPRLGSRKGLLSHSLLTTVHLFHFLGVQKRREKPLYITRHGRGKLYLAFSSWKGLLGLQNNILFQDSIQKIYSSDLKKKKKGEARRKPNLWSSFPKPGKSLTQDCLFCIHCLIHLEFPFPWILSIPRIVVTDVPLCFGREVKEQNEVTHFSLTNFFVVRFRVTCFQISNSLKSCLPASALCTFFSKIEIT